MVYISTTLVAQTIIQMLSLCLSVRAAFFITSMIITIIISSVLSIRMVIIIIIIIIQLLLSLLSSLLLSLLLTEGEARGAVGPALRALAVGLPVRPHLPRVDAALRRDV